MASVKCPTCCQLCNGVGMTGACNHGPDEGACETCTRAHWTQNSAGGLVKFIEEVAGIPLKDYQRKYITTWYDNQQLVRAQKRQAERLAIDAATYNSIFKGD